MSKTSKICVRQVRQKRWVIQVRSKTKEMSNTSKIPYMLDKLHQRDE